MLTPKYQLIQFAEQLSHQEDCETFVPVDDGYTTAFLITDNGYDPSTHTQRIDLVTPDGELLKRDITYSMAPYIIGSSDSHEHNRIHTLRQIIRKYLAPGDCFRLRLVNEKPTTENIYNQGRGFMGHVLSDVQLANHEFVKILNTCGCQTYIGSPMFTKGIWTITIKKPKLVAMYKPNGTLKNKCAMKIGIFKEATGIATSPTATDPFLVKEVAKDTEEVTFTFTLKKDTYIQVGITTAEDHDYSVKRWPSEITIEGITATQDEIRGYSNILVFTENQGEYSHFKYACDEEGTFDIPWGSHTPVNAGTNVTYLQCLVPILVKKPQFNHSDKVYEKSDGKQVVLYANFTKEYSGETDYIDYETHEKIMIALCCDNVFIDGERLTKSDKYEIDWDNQMETDCGRKLVRATFKMKANITSRNGNC